MGKNEKTSSMQTSPSKVVGSKQVLRGLSEGTIRCVIVAEDAEAHIKAKVAAAAFEKGVPVETVPSKEELGRSAGIKIGAAAVGIICAEE